MSVPPSSSVKAAPKAKIIQIAVSEHVLYCLGDDGSLYRLVVPPTENFSVAQEDWYQLLHAPPYYP